MENKVSGVYVGIPPQIGMIDFGSDGTKKVLVDVANDLQAVADYLKTISEDPAIVGRPSLVSGLIKSCSLEERVQDLELYFHELSTV